MKNTLMVTSILVVGAIFNVQAQSIHSNLEVHAQTTVVNQTKPSWNAPYSGTNSLTTNRESQTSVTSTLYAGLRIRKNAGLFINPEIAGGSGLSQVLGLGDATNGETFRIGSTSPKVYMARLYYTQKFAIGNKFDTLEADFNQLSGLQPKSYVGVTVGKICLTDYFDKNAYSHDPRTQFMCWGLMANGAWDYAANTRGYTPSIVVELVKPTYEFRTAISLLPTVANGNIMNWDVFHSNSLSVEWTKNGQIKSHSNKLRILGFYNSAHMANYALSIAQNPIAPDLVLNRNIVRHKYGFGINFEQELTENSGIFCRASWNDGHNETWAFTEIDHSVSFGYHLEGHQWKRDEDVFGIAMVHSGLSKGHQNYLKAGGTAFMLGDGQLNYSWEHLVETYYAIQLEPNRLFLTVAYQTILNPGYNSDRKGPIQVFSVRLHANI